VPTSTKLSSSSNPAASGASVTFKATIGPLDLRITPTGTVTFRDGTQTLGVVPLGGSCFILISSCTASFTPSPLPDGTHAITASYSGDAYSARSSATITQVMRFAPSDFALRADQSMSAAPGGSTSTGIATTWVSGLRGLVALRVTGLPAGATATLTPSSVTAGDSSTLSVNAGSAADGDYTLTVTGTEGGVSHSTQVSLTIAPPPPNDFSISAAPNDLSLTTGATDTSTISTAVVDGAAGTVDLSVSGVPVGATATLESSSVTAGGSVTLMVNAGTAAPGNYTITVTGTETVTAAATGRQGREGLTDQTTPSHYTTVGVSVGSGLIDHGGKILAVSHTYAIWWGNQAAFPSDAKTGIVQLFNGFNGTNFLAIAHQYMRGASVSSSFVASANDTTAPPTRSPSTSTIVNEAGRAINANHWATDSSAIYFVFTSNFPSGINFCAWHSHGTVNGKDVQVAYMPNTTGISGCNPGNLYNSNTYSEGTRSLANVTSHEFMEAITDADLNAWYDSAGSEIGDKCAWRFGSTVNLNNSHWQLQEEWSNAAGGCVQQ
jgi:hypothetical protein